MSDGKEHVVFRNVDGKEILLRSDMTIEEFHAAFGSTVKLGFVDKDAPFANSREYRSTEERRMK